MRIHPREQNVTDAENELRRAILDVVQKHGLTEGEQIQVVVSSSSGFLQSIARYAIREERHGRTDKPGGLE